MRQIIVVAMAASCRNEVTSISVATKSDGTPFKLNDNLDGAFPKVLTMIFVWFVWWLMDKKNISLIRVLLFMAVVGVVELLIYFF